MKKYFKVTNMLLRNALIRDLKMPGVVASSVLFELLEITISIVFFDLIFTNTGSLGGWNFYQVLTLYAFAKFINGFYGAFCKRGIQSMAQELVRMGNLDFFLTKPLNSMYFVSVSKPRVYTFINCLLSLFLGIYSIAHTGIAIGIDNVFWFVVLAIAGIVLYYFLAVITIVPVFWFIRLWALQSVMTRMNQFMRYPANIFAPFLKFSLFVFFPVMTASYFPVSALFYNPGWKSILFVFIITFMFGIITTSFWKMGLRKYGSASS